MTPLATESGDTMRMIFDHNRLTAQVKAAKIPADETSDMVLRAFALAGGYTDRMDWEECHFSDIARDDMGTIFTFASAPANHLDRTEFQVFFLPDGRGKIWQEGQPRPWPHPRDRRDTGFGC